MTLGRLEPVVDDIAQAETVDTEEPITRKEAEGGSGAVRLDRGDDAAVRRSQGRSRLRPVNRDRLSY